MYKVLEKKKVDFGKGESLISDIVLANHNPGIMTQGREAICSLEWIKESNVVHSHESCLNYFLSHL
jgi:hypothetical protein